jgi:SAM-dependent methyltransferase
VTDPVEDFKQGARATWAAGNWDEVSSLIAGVGPALLDTVGIDPGMDVLDVGTGSGGTVSIPAAQRGATVVGSDLTPELFDAARRRAADAGVEVEWVEADAEALPFEDESFDRVLSTFGHMFAPRHAVAAAELARVLRKGGVLGTATWTPEGQVGAFFAALSGHLPAPPDLAERPMAWGDEGHVRELLEPHGLELEFERRNVTFEESSADELVNFYERNFGPVVMARAALGERWPEARADVVRAFEDWNEADDGTLRVSPEYLVTIGRKRG